MGQFGGNFGTSYPSQKEIEISVLNHSGKKVPNTLVVKRNNSIEVIVPDDLSTFWKSIALGAFTGVLLTILILTILGM